MLFDTVLAFDHVKHRILIIANARVTADGRPLARLTNSRARSIQILERELERGLSQSVLGAAGKSAGTSPRTSPARGTEVGCPAPIKERIAAGDIYQALLLKRFEMKRSSPSRS